jgi:hypothetical protein
MTAGYSGTPLGQKLGIKPGSRLWAKGAPANYRKLIGPLPEGATLVSRAGKALELIHLFTRSRKALAKDIPGLMARIRRDGSIWVSWPKRASGVATDVTEDVIRALALPLGLVDVKVCAVDETWSGLKLVIRKLKR